MKRKHRKLPGVTLLELIIVLAIFSGIAVGAMAMVRPALKVYHMSAAQEKAVSSVDSVARYIQDNLRYAENVVIYRNHGIKDLDLLLNTPFEMCRQGKRIIVQQSQAGKSIYRYQTTVKKGEPGYDEYMKHMHNASDIRFGFNAEGIWDADTATQNWKTAGTADDHQWINPLSYYAKTYYADSVCNEDNYTTDSAGTAIEKRNKNAAEYYRDKVIYIMEITDNAEVNIYRFPLGDDTNVGDKAIYYNVGYIGIVSWDGGQAKMTKTSVDPEFSGDVKLKNMVVGETASEGFNMTLNVSYKGTTQDIDFDYNFAVSFPNAALRPSYTVNEMKHSNPVDSYDYFDWADKFFSWPYDSIDGKEGCYTGKLKDVSGYGRQYYCPTTSELYTTKNGKTVYNADKAGYVYIIYSIPEIVP